MDSKNLQWRFSFCISLTDSLLQSYQYKSEFCSKVYILWWPLLHALKPHNLMMHLLRLTWLKSCSCWVFGLWSQNYLNFNLSHCFPLCIALHWLITQSPLDESWSFLFSVENINKFLHLCLPIQLYECVILPCNF